MGKQAVCRLKFEDLWSELRPNIAAMKPTSDLCENCQSNIVKIMCSANVPDSEKSKNINKAELHLVLAKQERAVYNNECVKAAEELKLNPVSPKLEHVSFDYVYCPLSP